MGFSRPISEELLASVYATAGGGGRWVDFCETLSRISDAPIMMYACNIGSKESLGIISGGMDTFEIERYHQHFAELNPWMHMNVAMPVGMVGISDQALAKPDLFKTEFYNDWLKPQGDIAGGVASICYRTRDSLAAIALSSHARHYDKMVDENFDVLSGITGHIGRAIELSKLLAVQNDNSSFYHETAQQVVINIHRSGKVGHINSVGETLLSNNNIFAVSVQQNLTTRNEELRNFFNQATSAMHVQAYAKLPPPMPVHIKDIGACMFHAHIFPENQAQEFPDSVWSDPVAGMIVITSSNGFNETPDYQGLVRAFGATRAEARLAQAVLEGQSVYDYADQNGLSRHTVRNQMRALRMKTNTSDRAGFVRNILNLASPFSAPEQ